MTFIGTTRALISEPKFVTIHKNTLLSVWLVCDVINLCIFDSFHSFETIRRPQWQSPLPSAWRWVRPASRNQVMSFLLHAGQWWICLCMSNCPRVSWVLCIKLILRVEVATQGLLKFSLWVKLVSWAPFGLRVCSEILGQSTCSVGIVSHQRVLCQCFMSRSKACTCRNNLPYHQAFRETYLRDYQV